MPDTPEYTHGDTAPPLSITPTVPVPGGETISAHVVRAGAGLGSIDRSLTPALPAWLLDWQPGDLANTGTRWVEYQVYLRGSDGSSTQEPIRIVVNPAPV